MSKLFLIPTPIGNLEDMTFRGLRILKEVDLILAEDTRQTKKLLAHYDISKPVLAHHQHNEHAMVKRIADRILSGDQIALVSDAGTPAISDPGFLLVRTCLEADIEIECLPGATAFVPALVNSGLPADRFCFEGFLPHKKGRQKRLLQIQEEPRTLIFYESPHRLVKTLNQLGEFMGEDRLASVSRELTKMHEETRHGSLKILAEHYETNGVKGEIVIVVAGFTDKNKASEKANKYKTEP